MQVYFQKYHWKFTHSLIKLGVIAFFVPAPAKTLYHLTNQTPHFHKTMIKHL